MTAPERIEKVLSETGIKAPTLAKNIGVKYQRIYDITRGKTSNITFEVANAINKKYPIYSIAWLMYDEQEPNKEYVSEGGAIHKMEVKEKIYTNQLAVKVVSSTAMAGFSQSYYADEYLENMPTILIEADKEYKGKYLAFEVNGDSMEPEYNEGDIVICREIPRANWQYKLHYKDWDFVIAHGTQGIMLKEITDHNIETGEITCHSINEDMHPDFTLNLREITYLFNVVEHRIQGRRRRTR